MLEIFEPIYVRDEQMPQVDMNMIDSGLEELCCYAIKPVLNRTGISANEISNMEKYIEDDIKLYKLCMEVFRNDSKTIPKHGIVTAFLNILNQDLPDESFVCDFMYSLETMLTNVVNKELQFCAPISGGSIDSFQSDIISCLNYYSDNKNSQYNKFFKLRLLNKLDFIIENTLIVHSAIFSNLKLENILINVNESFGKNSNPPKKIDKRCILEYAMLSPLFISKKFVFKKKIFNTDTIRKGMGGYDTLKECVEKFNMNSFDFSIGNTIQGRNIVEVFYNPVLDEFKILL